MKSRLLLIAILLISAFNIVLAEPPQYIQTKGNTGKPNTIKIERIADNAIRPIAAPEREIFPAQILIWVYSKRNDLALQMTSTSPDSTAEYLNAYRVH